MKKGELVESSLDMRRSGSMGASEPNANEYDELGQFDERKSRRRRRAWWLAGFVALVIVLFTVIPRLADRFPETSAGEIAIQDLFPVRVSCSTSIQRRDVEVLGSMEADTGAMESAHAFYVPTPRHRRDGLIDLEIRIDRFDAVDRAKNRLRGPRLSLPNVDARVRPRLDIWWRSRSRSPR